MVTQYKNNSQFSSKFKAYSLLQLCNNMKVETPSIGYYSYTTRWQTLKYDT